MLSPAEAGAEREPVAEGFAQNDGADKAIFYLTLLAACLFLLFLALPLLRGTVYEFDDLNNYHLPYRYFYSQCLKASDNFTWIPNVFCGFYLHGEGQVGMFHPLHLLLYRFLPLNVAYNLELILSYPFMLAGMFLFLRRWNLPRGASMLGAFIFAFSGFNIMHYVHMNAVAVASHIPWMLLSIDMVVKGKSSSGRAWGVAGLAVLTGSQLLLGHPSTFWLSAVIELLYTLFLIRPWGYARVYATLGAAKILGAMIGAIQLLAHYEAAINSTRLHPPLDFLLWPSVHPAHLLQMVAPYFFNEYAFEGIGYDLKMYNGAIPLVLLVVLTVRRKELGVWRGLAAGVIGLSAFSVVMAMGKYGYLFYLQTFLPLVRLLRTPCRYFLLFHFALAVGAAVAFADMSDLSRNKVLLKRRNLAPLLAPAIAAFVPFLLMVWAKAGSQPALAKYFLYGMNAETAFLIAGPLLFLLAAVLVAMALRGSAYARYGIAAFVVMDLFLYAFTYLGASGARTIEMIVSSFPTPSEDPKIHRIQSNDNIFILKNARLAGGYASIPPNRELENYDGVRLKLAGAHSVLSKKAFELGGGSTYGIPLPEPFPRVRMVAKAAVSEHPKTDLASIDPASTVLVSMDVQLQDGPPGKASLVVDRPGKMTIETECVSRQFLALSESYHEGWRVMIDGKSAQVIRAYGDFMGCVVEAGAHLVEFEFRPKSLIIGAWMSGIGVVLTLLIFLWRWRKSRALSNVRV